MFGGTAYLIFLHCVLGVCVHRGFHNHFFDCFFHVGEPTSLILGQFKTIFSSSFKTPPSPFSASLPPWTIGRILFQHKFPGHAGANLANFIVSHFLRIYSLIHHPGRAGPNYINPCHCSPARESQTVNLAGKICAFDPLSMKRHHFGWTWKVLCAAFSHFKRCSSKKLNEKHEEVMMTMMITRMVGI